MMPTTIIDNESYPEALDRRYAEESRIDRKIEIIAMAKSAGFFEFNVEGWVKEFERFAALVAEPWIETNKALANEIIELKKQVDISALPIIIEAAVKEAVLAEREACAKVCDELIGTRAYAVQCASAIRARSDV